MIKFKINKYIMNNLEQKTKEFIEAIKEMSEFKDYQKAEEIYKQDKDAQTLLKDFQMARQNLAILKQGNFSGQEEQREKFEDLQSQVRGNEVINDWIDKRKKFHGLVDSLASNISSDINFPFTYTQKSKGCCG